MSEKFASEPSSSKEPRRFDRDKIRKAMTQVLVLARKTGAAAVNYYRRLTQAKSPQEMLRITEETEARNRARAAELSRELEGLFREISEKKKSWLAAPAALQRALEAELRTLLARYEALEREQRVVLENQRVLAQVSGRIREILAYEMAGVAEEEIDRWAALVEEKAEEAEARSDAVRDLQRAGRRRERESDREAFLDQLARFELPADNGEAKPLEPERAAPPEKWASEAAHSPPLPSEPAPADDHQTRRTDEA